MSKSSLPEVSNTCWNESLSVSSSSDGLLHPVSEDSVVNWFSSNKALNNLVEPLVSSVAWSSGNNLAEVVNHVWEGWSSSSESSSSPSNVSSS